MRNLQVDVWITWSHQNYTKHLSSPLHRLSLKSPAWIPASRYNRVIEHANSMHFSRLSNPQGLGSCIRGLGSVKMRTDRLVMIVSGRAENVKLSEKKLTNLQIPSPNIISNSACLYGLETYDPKIPAGKRNFASILSTTQCFEDFTMSASSSFRKLQKRLSNIAVERRKNAP